MALAKEDDGDMTFGAPYIEGASVTATVMGDGKGKKLVVYKFRSKKDSHRKKGHRQPFTKLRIDGIEAPA
jgi:large subunit ribosomal protein L21